MRLPGKNVDAATARDGNATRFSIHKDRDTHLAVMTSIPVVQQTIGFVPNDGVHRVAKEGPSLPSLLSRRP